MKKSYCLVLNEGYVNENVFSRTLKKEEVEGIDLYTINNTDYLLHIESKPKMLSIFKNGLKNPSYKQISFLDLLPLLLYIQENELDFYFDAVGSNSSEFKEMNEDLRCYYLPKLLKYKKNKKDEEFNKLLEEFDDDYGIDYIKGMYLSFDEFLVNKEGKKKRLDFKVYQSSVIYVDSYKQEEFMDVIEQKIFDIYKMITNYDMNIKEVVLPLKTVQKHPYANLNEFMSKTIELVEKGDKEALYEHMNDNKDKLKRMEKAFLSYKDKLVEV